MDKLNDLKLEDGNYRLGDCIYDRRGNFVEVIEEIPDTEKFEMELESEKRKEDEKKYV